MNRPVPHHKLPCSFSWGGFLLDIYQSVHLLFSFPLHHPIHLEEGLILYLNQLVGLSVRHAKDAFRLEVEIVAWLHV